MKICKGWGQIAPTLFRFAAVPHFRGALRYACERRGAAWRKRNAAPLRKRKAGGVRT